MHKLPDERMSEVLENSVRDILKNGHRLLEDASFLEYSDPPTSAIYLTYIAQEEFAKAFLLCLVMRRIIPWNNRLLRATKDHTCKQLLCVVLDYLDFTDDKFLRKEIPSFPRKVSDAIFILRHEKIGRWVSNPWWCWDEDPDYDREALSVAEGAKDKQKQDSLYVRLGKDGSVASDPRSVPLPNLREELERARGFESLVKGFIDEEAFLAFDWHSVEAYFREIFAKMWEDPGQGETTQ